MNTSESSVLFRSGRALAVSLKTCSGTQSFRSFAWLALPEGRPPEGGFPGIVLVHGGAGWADREWALEWASRGFAAVAPDFNAQRFDESGALCENPEGGPKGYGSFDAPLRDPAEFGDLWFGVSVAAIRSARAFLCGLEGVCPTRIGVMGISWGGVLALRACGMERGFFGACIVYSSAYLAGGLGSVGAGYAGLTPEQRKVYDAAFDPAPVLDRIDCPVLFVTDAADGCFSVPSRKRTAAKIAAPFFCYRELEHGHNAARACAEPAAFFEDLRAGRLPEPVDFVVRGRTLVKKWKGRDRYRVLTCPDVSGPSDEWCWRAAEWTRGETAEIPPDARALLVQIEIPAGIRSSDVLFAEEL